MRTVAYGISDSTCRSARLATAIKACNPCCLADGQPLQLTVHARMVAAPAKPLHRTKNMKTVIERLSHIKTKG